MPPFTVSAGLTFWQRVAELTKRWLKYGMHYERGNVNQYNRLHVMLAFNRAEILAYDLKKQQAFEARRR